LSVVVRKKRKSTSCNSVPNTSDLGSPEHLKRQGSPRQGDKPHEELRIRAAHPTPDSFAGITPWTIGSRGEVVTSKGSRPRTGSPRTIDGYSPKNSATIWRRHSANVGVGATSSEPSAPDKQAAHDQGWQLCRQRATRIAHAIYNGRGRELGVVN